MPVRSFVFPSLLLFAACAVACKGPASGGTPKPDLDADPLALLPEAALFIVTLDTKGMIEAGAGGASVATIADAFIPLGDDSGLVPSRDVDRVVAAGYDMAGANVTAVMSGRFDTDKIAAATKTRKGDPIAVGHYLTYTTYSVGAVAYVPLTRRTLLAGTGNGLQRALDRLQAGKVARAMPPWVVETLETKGAELAVVADYTTHPITNATIGSVSVPWLAGLQVARVIGDFAPPGLNVAATLTYGDPAQAERAAQGVHLVAGWLTTLAPLIGGMSIQGLDVTTEASALQCKFAVDDHTLQTLVSLAPRLQAARTP